MAQGIPRKRAGSHRKKRGKPAHPTPRIRDNPQFRRGVSLFNSRRFFDAHEVWEELWLAAHGEDKLFLQGLIQVAAAFHHASRDNRAGAESLLRAGIKKLEKFAPAHYGIALNELRIAARHWLNDAPSAEFRNLQPPKIMWVKPSRRKRTNEIGKKG